MEVGKGQKTGYSQARGLRCAAVWPTPGPGAKLNKIVHVGKGQRARCKQPWVCTLRTSADGLPRRQIAVWSAKRGCVKGPPMVVDALCDSGSTAAVASRQKFEELGGELKVFTHDTINFASSLGEELQIKGAFDVWVKLSEEDKYKRKIKVLVIDGIDEDLIQGVEQLKLLGLLPRQWQPAGQGVRVEAGRDLRGGGIAGKDRHDGGLGGGFPRRSRRGAGSAGGSVRFAKMSTQWMMSQASSRCPKGCRRYFGSTGRCSATG